jgi:cell division protein FtsB
VTQLPIRGVERITSYAGSNHAGMRLLTLGLAGLIILLQYPLWLGKGGWLRVWEVDQQVRAQHQTNQKSQLRNIALDAEVRDLKQGLEALEERARSELGMIKQDEIFFQVLDNPRGTQPTAR